jgi:adenosylcobinamide-GDP ribazoletransferase
MARALICAIGFLTRIPVPTVVVDDAGFARSAGFFSWVGALLGLMLQSAVMALAPVFGPRVAGLCFVAGLAWLSGGLHADGLADTADGLSGGRGRPERALEIMRDSRIGAHGALALILVMLMKAELAAAPAVSACLWVVPALSRYASTWLLAVFPYARAAGLGKSFAGRVGRAELSLGVLPFAALAWGSSSLGMGLALVAGVLFALALAWRLSRFLRGITGDVVGAAVELTEVVVLFGLVLATR